MKPLACARRCFSSLVASLLLLAPPVVAQRKVSPVQNGAGVAQLSVHQQDALNLMKTLAQNLRSESDKLTAARTASTNCRRLVDI